MAKKMSIVLECHLFFLLMFCFAAAIIGDSTSEALLLSRFSASLIPKMFLANSLMLFALSALLLRIIDRIDRRKFFMRALFTHACIIAAIRIASEAGIDSIYLPLFSYAYGTKILFFLLFWTVANDLIDSHSAGKTFPAIAAGGTIGAIGISFSISAMMHFFAVKNLLLIWALLSCTAGLLLIPLRKRYTLAFNEPKTPLRASVHSPNDLPVLTLFRENRLLASMSLLYATIFFILLNQHFIFYQLVKNAFSSAESIASFLGKFNGISMVCTILLQIGFAGILLRKLGSTRSMLLLPASLIAVFTVQFAFGNLSVRAASPIFAIFITGMGMRMAFFDAFFSPNFQLFFSSLPVNIRGRSKLLIEGLVKPFAMVLAGLFLLWAPRHMSLSSHTLLLALASLGAFFLALQLKKAYTLTLARYLTGTSSPQDTTVLDRFEITGDGDFLSFFARHINNEDFEVQQFLVGIIASDGTSEAATLLLNRLPESEAKLRATILASLGAFPAELVESTLKQALADPDSRIVANAIAALHHCGAASIEALLLPFANHPHRRVRLNAIIALWPLSDQKQRDEFTRHLTTMLYGNDLHDRSGVLYATRQLHNDTMDRLLYDFCASMRNETMIPNIVHRQMVLSLGTRTCGNSIGVLLDIADRSSYLQRRGVIKAIAEIMPHIDDTTWITVFEKGTTLRRHCILSALRKMRKTPSPELFRMLGTIAMSEREAIERDRNALLLLSASNSDRMVLLSYAIREELLSVTIANLLDIAALLDISGTIAATLPRLHHNDLHIRARAFEILENTGDTRINRMVAGYLEWFDRLQNIPIERNAVAMKKEQDIAGAYCSNENEWVSICALFAGKAE